MKARITVRLKGGVLDPQGMTIRKSLLSLGYDEVQQGSKVAQFDDDRPFAHPVRLRACSASDRHTKPARRPAQESRGLFHC